MNRSAAWILFFACISAAAVDAAEAPRPDIAQMVLMMDGPRDKKCAERKVVHTEVVGARVERWTVDRCGKLVNYRVRFTPNSKGGTDFDVQLEK